MDRQPLRLVAVLGAVLSGAAGLSLAGCTPSIGDKCSISTDCSVRGDRVCDTSQPGGYCTLFNCTSNSCPNNAACVEFNASVPGCPYDDYRSPARTARTFCMATCGSDSDCRQSDGYACLDPRSPPWSAVILDTSSSRRVCVVAPRSTSQAPSAGAAVCTAGAAVADAAVPLGDAAGEASVDSGGLDAALLGDTSDSSAADSGGAGASDGAADAPSDSDATDAPTGG